MKAPSADLTSLCSREPSREFGGKFGSQITPHLNVRQTLVTPHGVHVRHVHAIMPTLVHVYIAPNRIPHHPRVAATRVTRMARMGSGGRSFPIGSEELLHVSAEPRPGQGTRQLDLPACMSGSRTGGVREALLTTHLTPADVLAVWEHVHARVGVGVFGVLTAHL